MARPARIASIRGRFPMAASPEDPEDVLSSALPPGGYGLTCALSPRCSSQSPSATCPVRGWNANGPRGGHVLPARRSTGAPCVGAGHPRDVVLIVDDDLATTLEVWPVSARLCG